MASKRKKARHARAPLAPGPASAGGAGAGADSRGGAAGAARDQSSGQRRPPVGPSRSARRAWWRGPGALVGLLAAVAVVIGVFAILARTPTPPRPPPPDAAAPIVSQVTHVSPGVISAIGAGGLSDHFQAAGRASPLTGPSGKPEMLYVGAEFCPYCAAERWSLLVALGRFGTFSGVALNRSSSNDAYPDTPTFTFRKSSYSSAYLDFVTVELEDRDHRSLQTPTAAQQALINKYDQSGYIPFLDMGNRYTTTGGWIPSMLAGKSWQQIAGDLANPQADSTRAIVGHANYLTAAICRVTGQKPGSVCATPLMRQLQARLG
ncbi:MAG: DUF929 family protein [Candidatus Dormibacteraceae bacterium]